MCCPSVFLRDFLIPSRLQLLLREGTLARVLVGCRVVRRGLRVLTGVSVLMRITMALVVLVSTGVFVLMRIIMIVALIVVASCTLPWLLSLLFLFLYSLLLLLLFLLLLLLLFLCLLLLLLLLLVLFLRLRVARRRSLWVTHCTVWTVFGLVA